MRIIILMAFICLSPSVSHSYGSKHNQTYKAKSLEKAKHNCEVVQFVMNGLTRYFVENVGCLTEAQYKRYIKIKK